MTGLTLTKHHGLGNDFLVLFADDGDAPGLPAIARRLCHRTRGIGADGLLVGSPEDGFDARMVLYNADGSRAEMSGNGIRCFAQAVAGRRGDLATQRILTDAGPRTVELFATEDPFTIMAAVDMGEVADLPEPAGWAALGANPDRPVAHLGLGNPHTVVGVDDVLAVDLRALGERIPHVNLEIVEPGPERDAITMRVPRARRRHHRRPAGRAPPRLRGPRPGGARRRRHRGTARAHGRRQCESGAPSPGGRVASR